MFAVAEDYPDLRANENFLSLQNDLAEVEDKIQAARRYYNGSVREMNTKVDQFPKALNETLCRISSIWSPFDQLSRHNRLDNGFSCLSERWF